MHNYFKLLLSERVDVYTWDKIASGRTKEESVFDDVLQESNGTCMQRKFRFQVLRSVQLPSLFLSRFSLDIRVLFPFWEYHRQVSLFASDLVYRIESSRQGE